MSEAKLKRCPFCGEEAKVIYYDNGWCAWYHIACTQCHISQTGSYTKTEEEAIAAWNTRKPMEQIIERLKTERMKDYDNSDEEPEYTDVEDWYNEGKSSGRFQAYGNAINLIKEINNEIP